MDVCIIGIHLWMGPSSSANPSGVQGICPSGWHVPSDSEWNELEESLGMPSSGGNQDGSRGTHATIMKSLVGWEDSGNGNNLSRMNIYPAGYWISSSSDGFERLGFESYLWSSTQYNSTSAWYRKLSISSDGVSRFRTSETFGLSCRCVKD